MLVHLHIPCTNFFFAIACAHHVLGLLAKILILIESCYFFFEVEDGCADSAENLVKFTTQFEER